MATELGANREALAQRLRTLNSTQQSIESTAQWCLFYSSAARSVVAVWEEELMRAPTQQRLSYLYLANHILQACGPHLCSIRAMQPTYSSCRSPHP